jgi:hypothetical protein
VNTYQRERRAYQQTLAAEATEQAEPEQVFDLATA